MPIRHIEHYLVLTDDLEATRRFYCDVLGFTAGFRPELDFPGFWFYAGDVPCIHVGERDAFERRKGEPAAPSSERTSGTGTVDHVAFSAAGFDEIKARLDAAGLAYRQQVLDDIGLRQIFVADPNGVTLELNFRDDPAAGHAS